MKCVQTNARSSNFVYKEGTRGSGLSHLIPMSLLRSATVGAFEIFKRTVNPLLSAVLRKTEIVGILGLTGTQGAFVILVKV